MSTKSKFREALERPEGSKESSPVVSGSPVRLLLRSAGPISRPIDVARLLAANGLSLRNAHAKLQKIGAKEVVPVEIRTDDPGSIIAKLALLGVSAARIRAPDVDVKCIRQQYGYSQADFAARFGFELDTIQNWEQGRNSPDVAARIVLALIMRSPSLVQSVLTETPVSSVSKYASVITVTATSSEAGYSSRLTPPQPVQQAEPSSSDLIPISGSRQTAIERAASLPPNVANGSHGYLPGMSY